MHIGTLSLLLSATVCARAAPLSANFPIAPAIGSSTTPSPSSSNSSNSTTDAAAIEQGDRGLFWDHGWKMDAQPMLLDSSLESPAASNPAPSPSAIVRAATVAAASATATTYWQDPQDQSPSIDAAQLQDTSTQTSGKPKVTYGGQKSSVGASSGPRKSAQDPAYNPSANVKLPPLAPQVTSDLLNRLTEPFNISLPESHREGVIKNCDTDLAYSFDDGPYKWHDELNRLFQNSDAKATFFVNGKNWNCIYDEENVSALRTSYAAGHLIGTHTWSHAHLNTLTEDQIDIEIQLMEEALWKILGAVPAFIRPPYGEANETTVRYLNKHHGLTVVTWDLDSRDSAGFSGNASIEVLSTMKYPDPHMPLSHETYQSSVEEVAATMVPKLRAQGYKMPTISQCLGNMSPYKIQGRRQERDSSWTCDGKGAAPSGSNNMNRNSTAQPQ